MKKLYTFQAKVGEKEIEVFVAKPTQSEIEDAEYVHAKEFNQLIQDGFLSKAMMNKKFGDIGGTFSEKSNKELSEVVIQLIEAKKRIEFYGGAKTLTEDQQEELDQAKETFSLLQKKLVENDIALQSMYAKSADTKAEEHMIKWFILNSTYFISEVDEGELKKRADFKLFDKNSFQEKQDQLNLLFEEIEDFDSEQIKLKKQLVQTYFVLIGRVISIWYNGLGQDQDSIQKALEEFFPEDYKEEEKPVKKRRSK